MMSSPSREGVPAAWAGADVPALLGDPGQHLHLGPLSSLCTRNMKIPEQSSDLLLGPHLHICSVLPPCSQDPCVLELHGVLAGAQWSPGCLGHQSPRLPLNMPPGSSPPHAARGQLVHQ